MHHHVDEGDRADASIEGAFSTRGAEGFARMGRVRRSSSGFASRSSRDVKVLRIDEAVSEDRPAMRSLRSAMDKDSAAIALALLLLLVALVMPRVDLFARYL